MKRSMYKTLAVILVVLLALNFSVVNVLAEDNTVTPSATDYSISGSTITGLKPAYLSSLTDVQKQNISLVIPGEIDQVPVTGIGAKAFKQNETRYVGCRFIKLNFVESQNLTEIGEYAFSNCNITEVDIPDSVTTIGSRAFKLDNKSIGIVGTIKMPNSLEYLGAAAFYNQAGLTSVDFNNCEIATISEQAFRYSGIKGVIYLPSKLKTIETSAFAETDINTVYLPKGMESIIGNAFFSCNKLKDIICADYDDYKIVSKTTFSNNGKLTCIFPINFRNEGSTATLSKKTCLVLRAYNYEQQDDGTWCENKDYRFPQIEGKSWSNKKDVPSIRTEKDIITGNFLYQVDAIEKPVITYSSGIDKTYDGEEATLSVKAEHPLAVPSSEAQAGDVIFYYTWAWSTIGSTPAVLEGYDENEYGVLNYRAPYAIECSVKVQTCLLNGDNTVTILYTDTHNFPVNLRQADPILPEIPHGIIQVDAGTQTLPEFPKVEGGTLAWDANQTLTEGFNTYSWTFAPDKNIENTYNYKPLKGKTQICPSTEPLTQDKVTEKISSLPEISSGEPMTTEQQNSILDTFLTVECAEEEIKGSVTEAQQEKIYESMAKLPNVTMEAPVVSQMKVDNMEALIRNLTAEDAVLLKQPGNKISINLTAEEKAPAAKEIAAMEALVPEAKIGSSFDIKIEKKIGTNTTTISEVKKKIQFTFDVPEAAKGAAELFLIRVHTDGNGMEAETLHDEDSNPNTITVSSDKFSTYAIAYTEKAADSGGTYPTYTQYTLRASAGVGGKITPEGAIKVYGGGSQTFKFVANKGYRIDQVRVDGKNIGAMDTYTFSNVWQAHDLAVAFKKIPPTMAELAAGVRKTTLKASSKATKGRITINWKKSPGYRIDYYQVFRSTKKYSGYGTKAYYTTKSGLAKAYTNTKSLKKGTRYYYKVRGVRILNGKKVYTKWSNTPYRIAR